MAKELTKTVDGAPLTADQFAAVGDPSNIDTWHLPVDTHKHVNSALDMYAHTDLPSSLKAPAARKIVARAKEEGLDTTDFVKNHLSSQTHGEAPRPWIEIFRAGDYSKTGKGVIRPEDLARVVKSYDPTYHEAPLTVGHPADNKPAFGWIDGLMADGGTLLAREKQVDPNFNEARKAGRYKKRSAAFYTDENGNITGLRHVAYLGAMPPEVKGLQDVAFNDHGSKFIMVDFGEDEPVAETKSGFEQFKAFFAELLNGSNAPKTFGEADITRIVNEAATAAAAPLQAKIASLETDLAAQKTQFAERERTLAGGATKLRAEQAVTKLKGAGKWIPAFDKAGVPLLFDELAKLSVTIEFGEGAEKKPTAPFDMLVNFLEGLPKIVPGGRLVESAPRTSGKQSTGDALTDAAKARAKEKNISFSEALDQIAAEQPELTTAGRSTAGAI
jgi:hypothetical protein